MYFIVIKQSKIQNLTSKIVKKFRAYKMSKNNTQIVHIFEIITLDLYKISIKS